MNQSNLKILLVDDVDFFRTVMSDYFRRTPAAVLTAGSGEEALNLAQRERPDLIYMDVNMPGLSGIEACRRIKAHPSLRKTPVLLVFTPGRDSSIEDVKSSGCDGYLAKPFGREEFLSLGHRYLFNIERRERRVPCQMTVDFVINGRPYRGRGVDISLHGLYVEFREELPPNRRVEATFLLPTVSSRMIEFTGRIAWINQGVQRNNMTLPQGFGIEILSIDMSSVDVIRAYLEKN